MGLPLMAALSIRVLSIGYYYFEVKLFLGAKLQCCAADVNSLADFLLWLVCVLADRLAHKADFTAM